MSFQSGGGSGNALWFFVFIIVGIVALVFVSKNPNFKKWLDALMKGTVPTGTTPPSSTPPPSTTPPPSGGTGAIDPSPTCPTDGEQCQEDDQGRYDCEQDHGDSYEATWCGSFSGDDLTIKMYGPPHSNDGDCCWCVLYVRPDSGQFVGGGEGPHPSSNCTDKADGESIGTTSDVCIKATIEPGPTITGYALVDGAWKQMINYTADCGCDETSSEKTGNQMTFRCDGDFNTTCANVKPFGGSGGGGGTTPPPAAEEEEEEEANLARIEERPMIIKVGNLQ